MELIELNATVRKTKGNSAAKALRRNAQLPAVLYGPNTEPISLTINEKDLELALKSSPAGQVLFNLTIQNGGSSTHPAMLKELQVHPVSQFYLHADFYEIAMDRKIRVKVPIITTGKSVGVEMGGLLQLVRRELEILCLPLEIPESIEIDITDLSIGDSIHVDELPLAGNIELPADVNFTVLTVVSPKIEEVEEEVEEEGEEVEGEEGAEDEAAEGKEADADAGEDD